VEKIRTIKKSKIEIKEMRILNQRKGNGTQAY
jgi:hypothetical protein